MHNDITRKNISDAVKAGRGRRGRFFKPAFPAFMLLAAFLVILTPGHGRAGSQLLPKNLTNPLLKFVKFRELLPFRYKLEPLLNERIASGDATRISVYFRSLNDGMWFGIGEKEQFSPASILKLPLLLACLKAAEKDPGILKKKMLYRNLDDKFHQNITCLNKPKPGEYCTVEKLLYLMIACSDNDAQFILSRFMGEDTILRTCRELGIVLPNNSEIHDFVSVRDIGRMFRILYNASYLSPEMSRKALKILCETAFDRGMQAGVPPGVAVAHKFGERVFPDTGEVQLHECGIVYYPENAYILCIMTKGRNLEILERLLRDISQVVYREVDSQYKSIKKLRLDE